MKASRVIANLLAIGSETDVLVASGTEGNTLTHIGEICLIDKEDCEVPIDGKEALIFFPKKGAEDNGK